MNVWLQKSLSEINVQIRRSRQDSGWPRWPLAQPPGLGGSWGAANGITAGGTVLWDRDQSEGVHEGAAHSSNHIQWHIPRPLSSTFNCLLAPPHTHPPKPSLAASPGGCLLSCGSPCQQIQTTTNLSCQRHEPPAFHIKAKRDSPNLRSPRHCLHKSSAYFCIKSSSFQSYSNARNKRLLWLHVMLKDRWRRAQCLCWIQMSAEIIPVIPNWCCICL